MVTKPRSTLPKRPGRLGTRAEDIGRNQKDLLCHKGLSLDGFSFTFSYAMGFYYEFPYKINVNTKTFVQPKFT